MNGDSFIINCIHYVWTETGHLFIVQTGFCICSQNTSFRLDLLDLPWIYGIYGIYWIYKSTEFPGSTGSTGSTGLDLLISWTCSRSFFRTSLLRRAGNGAEKHLIKSSQHAYQKLICLLGLLTISSNCAL